MKIKRKLKALPSPLWQWKQVFPETDGRGDTHPETFATVFAEVIDDARDDVDIGEVFFVPEERTILIGLNNRHAGVRSASLTGAHEK